MTIPPEVTCVATAAIAALAAYLLAKLYRDEINRLS